MSCREAEITASKHPCYSAESQHKFARMHLPVAPACNIQCNYCNRLYDCVNESRPGVTSEILSPEQAIAKIGRVQAGLDNLAVIGIAGPGDALANWPQTKATLVATRQNYPDLMLCLSTNGLMLPQYAEELVELGVRHVTVTLNSVDLAISEKIYRHIDWQGQRLTGQAGVRILLENQLAGIRILSARGVLVKINIVMIPGINDEHIPEVVKVARDLGACMTNIMPLIPAGGSAFGHLPQTSHKDVAAMRQRCQEFLPQMKHCQQCRADAIGLLTQDRSAEFRNDPVCPGDGCAGKSSEASTSVKPFRVAVTSKYLRLVDQHFGHAERFLIYETDGKTNRLIEQRQTSKYCSGNEFCEAEEEMKLNLVKKLSDCDAVVTMRLGAQARARLLAQGIEALESCESIDEALARTVEQLSIKQAG